MTTPAFRPHSFLLPPHFFFLITKFPVALDDINRFWARSLINAHQRPLVGRADDDAEPKREEVGGRSVRHGVRTRRRGTSAAARDGRVRLLQRRCEPAARRRVSAGAARTGTRRSKEARLRVSRDVGKARRRAGAYQTPRRRPPLFERARTRSIEPSGGARRRSHVHRGN